MAMPRSFGSCQVTFAIADPDLAVVDLDQTGDGIEQGGLAAARRAEQDEELAIARPRDPAARVRGSGRKPTSTPRSETLLRPFIA